MERPGVLWISFTDKPHLRLDEWGNQFRLRGAAGIDAIETTAFSWDVWLK